MDIEGKRVLIKFHLKLAAKPDIEELQAQFEHFLLNQEQEALRKLEEEKL
jgi:hypothetical protein